MATITLAAKALSQALRLLPLPGKGNAYLTKAVFVDADTSSVTLTATDLEMQLSLTLPATVVGSFAPLVLDAKQLLKLLPLVTGEVTISDEGLLLAPGIQLATHITQIDAEAAPPLAPFHDPELLAMLDGAELTTALWHATTATCIDGTRPALTGIELRLADQRATFTGADGYVLATASAPVTVCIPPKYPPILPRRMGLLAHKLRLRGAVSILQYDNRLVRLECHDHDLRPIITGRVIDAKYPDVQRVVTAMNTPEHSARITLATAQLRRGLALMLATTDWRKPVFHLHMGDHQLLLVNAEATGGVTREAASVRLIGRRHDGGDHPVPAATILNPELVLKGLAGAGDTVTLHLRPSMPGFGTLTTGVFHSQPVPGVRCASYVMPMSTRSDDAPNWNMFASLAAERFGPAVPPAEEQPESQPEPVAAKPRRVERAA